MFYSHETGGFYHPEIHPIIPTDAVELSAERYASLLIGLSEGQLIEVVHGDIQLALPPPPSEEALMQNLREQRDRLLAQSDWTQMPDAPLSESDQAAWRVYRQQLRDLPEAITDSANFIWPGPPTGEPA